jgi:putative intracellular protease/amidase
MSHKRVSTYVVAAMVPPAIALAWGVQSLVAREHPQPPPPLEAMELARVPRPPIDTAKPTVVILLGADLTEITDALGPYEVFARARKYNVVTASTSRQPSLLSGGLRVMPHYTLHELDTIVRHPAVVVVPNLPNADDAANRPIIDWIRQKAHAGATIHSWCKGAMALAETGLLDGGTATAHWGDIETLEARYPRVTWVRGVRWIDRGQLVMSAGITSGIDASLHLLRRIAGDSTARRIASEIRYPMYHYAIDPVVEQYSLRLADLVLVANAAFRPFRPTIGLGLYDGIGELDLSNLYDAHGHTMVATVEAVATDDRAIVTAHGLTVLPSLAVSGAPTRVRGLSRFIIPGATAREMAQSLESRVTSIAPRLGVEYIHANQPERFGLEAVLEDLGRTTDLPTARFAQRRMEYRAGGVSPVGAEVPWVVLFTVLELAATGVVGLWTFTHPAISKLRSSSSAGPASSTWSPAGLRQTRPRTSAAARDGTSPYATYTSHSPGRR